MCIVVFHTFLVGFSLSQGRKRISLWFIKFILQLHHQTYVFLAILMNALEYIFYFSFKWKYWLFLVKQIILHIGMETIWMSGHGKWFVSTNNLCTTPVYLPCCFEFGKWFYPCVLWCFTPFLSVSPSLRGENGFPCDFLNFLCHYITKLMYFFDHSWMQCNTFINFFFNGTIFNFWSLKVDFLLAWKQYQCHDI